MGRRSEITHAAGKAQEKRELSGWQLGERVYGAYSGG